MEEEDDKEITVQVEGEEEGDDKVGGGGGKG